jgi:hypothetical protein
MPAEYVKMRDEIHKNCLKKTRDSEAPKGKKPDETCLQYAKRIASMTFTKRHGKTPQEAESQIELVEFIERYLGLVENDETS